MAARFRDVLCAVGPKISSPFSDNNVAESIDATNASGHRLTFMICSETRRMVIYKGFKIQ
jgi:hypothetical protein